MATKTKVDVSLANKAPHSIIVMTAVMGFIAANLPDLLNTLPIPNPAIKDNVLLWGNWIIKAGTTIFGLGAIFLGNKSVNPLSK